MDYKKLLEGKTLAEVESIKENWHGRLNNLQVAANAAEERDDALRMTKAAILGLDMLARVYRVGQVYQAMDTPDK